MALRLSYGIESKPASQDIDANKLVKLDGSDELTPTTAVGDSVYGVLDKAVKNGKSASPRRGVVDYVEADEAIDAGDELMPSGNNAGRVLAYTGTAGDNKIGKALTSADSQGDLIRIELTANEQTA